MAFEQPSYSEQTSPQQAFSLNRLTHVHGAGRFEPACVRQTGGDKAFITLQSKDNRVPDKIFYSAHKPAPPLLREK